MQESQIRKAHRHIGVYGICLHEGKLLVIRKSRGPYRGRLDLPGGSLEPNEGVTAAVIREVAEETGVRVDVVRHVGVCDFFVGWARDDYSHEHHIAMLYETRCIGGEAATEVDDFDGQDSSGALWMSPEELSPEEASPALLEAVKWLQTGQLALDTQRFDGWVIKE